MASANDPFTWTPDIIPAKPLTPKYAILETPTEAFKRQIQLLSSTPLELFELDFGEILSTGHPTGNNRNDIKAHYDAQIHSYYNFYWNSVPGYISETPFYVRYEDYQETPVAIGDSIGIWKVKIVFRKDI